MGRTLTEPDENYEISEKGEVDRYIRVFFRCKFCKAEHAYPSNEGWLLESELEKLVHGPTTACPGYKKALLAPHYEPLINGKPAKHKHQYTIIDLIFKKN